MELARLQSAAMFAPDPPTATEASAAWEQVDVISASARRTVTRAARWRRRLRPIRDVDARTVTRRAVGFTCVSFELFDERGPLRVEGAHLGVDLGASWSTATNNASWPARSASRIWPSSRHAQTLRPSVTSRRSAKSSPDSRTQRTAACTRVDDRPASRSDRTTRSDDEDTCFRVNSGSASPGRLVAWFLVGGTRPLRDQ